jgi:hydroxymethylpyrimidine/phosphomethylpyrimidine kinase
VRTVLVLSGLDPSGGAGFLADARVVEQHGLRAAGAVTALTVQTTAGLREVHPVSPVTVAAQLDALLSDIEMAAGKIGMLGDEEVARAIAGSLALTGAPVVWDPVLAASAGGMSLFRGDPGRALALLADHVAVVTPNLAEAEALVGSAVASVDDMRRAARALAGGGMACLVKGGHLSGDDAVDVLALPGGDLVELERARVPGGERIHGTGCALSTALACALATGASVLDAARSATDFVAARMARPVRAGRGHPSIM